MAGALTRDDFWLNSGYHLLRRDARGALIVTDAYLRAYLGRPEIAPVPESCPEERALHAALLDDPRCAIPAARIAALADADARDNWRVFLQLRDLLIGHDSLEAAYVAQFRPGPVTAAPLFLDQMAHAILRNILDGCADPLCARAAELLFRRQKVTFLDGAVMLADEETVEMRTARGAVSLARLPTDPGSPRVTLDVIGRDNAHGYWERSDRFDMVLDATFARPGLDALCRVLEAWIAHLLGAAVSIHPVQSIRDEHWVWHVGLDAAASRILDELYEGEELPQPRLAQIIGLFRLEFADPARMLPGIAGRPVYLAMAANERNELQLKPQNLLVNLPLMPAA